MPCIFKNTTADFICNVCAEQPVAERDIILPGSQAHRLPSHAKLGAARHAHLGRSLLAGEELLKRSSVHEFRRGNVVGGGLVLIFGGMQIGGTSKDP